jgi:hypothetical protein
VILGRVGERDLEKWVGGEILSLVELGWGWVLASELEEVVGGFGVGLIRLC